NHSSRLGINENKPKIGRTVWMWVIYKRILWPIYALTPSIHILLGQAITLMPFVIRMPSSKVDDSYRLNDSGFYRYFSDCFSIGIKSFRHNYSTNHPFPVFERLSYSTGNHCYA